MRWFWLWLALAVVIVLGLGSLTLPAYWRLMNAGVATEATIEDLTKRDHVGVVYKYRVGGEEYTIGNPQKAGRVPADTMPRAVTILYEAGNPANATFGSPTGHFYNDLVAALMAGLIMPTFIIFAIRRWLAS